MNHVVDATMQEEACSIARLVVCQIIRLYLLNGVDSVSISE